jgi:filamentous hemagglutinin family protein
MGLTKMTGCKRQRWYGLAVVVLGVSGGLVSSVNCAFAQIVPDRTLPNNSSITTIDNIRTISGGTQAGSNLFHSFLEFSVPNGAEAHFNNGLDIQNIIGRVTGTSVSNIDGLIKANGAANLLLINPSGMIFGQDARLNIGGSFLGSTAASINFADGTQFSATTPQEKPLLTITAPTSLNMGVNVGQIQVTGPGHEIVYEDIQKETRPPVDSTLTGLGVLEGKTLALVGGKVSVEGAILKSPAGRIEIGSVGNNGVVSLVPVLEGWKLGYEGIPNGDIQFSGRPFLSATGVGGGGGGAIAIAGKNISFSGQAILISETLGSSDGKEISVIGDSIVLNESEINTNTFGSGNAGKVTLNAKNSILIKNMGGTSADTRGLGNAGEINLQANSIVFSGDKTGIGSNTNGKGDAGRISVKANSLLIENKAGFGSTSSGSGDAGIIDINVTDDFIIRNGSGLGNQTKGSGNAGIINIRGNSLLIENQSGFSNAALEGSTGNAGKININVRSLVLRNQVGMDTNTKSTGNAGEINITAESVLIGNESSISTRTSSSGNAGNLNLLSKTLVLNNGGSLIVESTGSGNAGNLKIVADTITLNPGEIRASATNGNGGDLTLDVGNLLLLRGSSQISATAGTANQGGDGGNITINSPNGFIVAAPNENSDITANAFKGKGGSVEINSAGNYFIAPLSREELQRLGPLDLDPRKLQTNDITAISRENPNLSGQVTINTSNFDPNRGLVALPTGVVDVSTLVASGCGAGDGTTGNQFTVTGRGGLPPSPEEPLSPDAIWSDTRVTNVARGQNNRVSAPVSPVQKVQEIFPATGWVFNGKGEVTLISNKSSAATSRMASANCSQR